MTETAEQAVERFVETDGSGRGGWMRAWEKEQYIYRLRGADGRIWLDLCVGDLDQGIEDGIEVLATIVSA